MSDDTDTTHSAETDGPVALDHQNSLRTVAQSAKRSHLLAASSAAAPTKSPMRGTTNSVIGKSPARKAPATLAAPNGSGGAASSAAPPRSPSRPVPPPPLPLAQTASAPPADTPPPLDAETSSTHANGKDEFDGDEDEEKRAAPPATHASSSSSAHAATAASAAVPASTPQVAAPVAASAAGAVAVVKPDWNLLMSKYTFATGEVHFSKLKMDYNDPLNRDKNDFYLTWSKYEAKEANRDGFSIRLYWYPERAPKNCVKDAQGRSTLRIIGPAGTLATSQLFPFGNFRDSNPRVEEKWHAKTMARVSFIADMDGYPYDESRSEPKDPKRRDRGFLQFVRDFGWKLDRWIATWIIKDPNFFSTNKTDVCERHPNNVTRQVDALMNIRVPFAPFHTEKKRSGGSGASSSNNTSSSMPPAAGGRGGGGGGVGRGGIGSGMPGASRSTKEWFEPKDTPKYHANRVADTDRFWMERKAVWSAASGGASDAKGVSSVETVHIPFHQNAMYNYHLRYWDITYQRLKAVIKNGKPSLEFRNVPIEDRKFQTCHWDASGRAWPLTDEEQEINRNTIMCPIVQPDYYFDATANNSVVSFGIRRSLQGIFELDAATNRRPERGRPSALSISADELAKAENAEFAEFAAAQLAAEQVKKEHQQLHQVPPPPLADAPAQAPDMGSPPPDREGGGGGDESTDDILRQEYELADATAAHAAAAAAAYEGEGDEVDPNEPPSPESVRQKAREAAAAAAAASAKKRKAIASSSAAQFAADINSDLELRQRSAAPQPTARGPHDSTQFDAYAPAPVTQPPRANPFRRGPPPPMHPQPSANARPATDVPPPPKRMRTDTSAPAAAAGVRPNPPLNKQPPPLREPRHPSQMGSEAYNYNPPAPASAASSSSSAAAVH